ncbi:MAG: TGS domain-containing protein [Anaerolineales bacterium]|nr:TGS domain-containing protein [Anaerolineales bacterium]
MPTNLPPAYFEIERRYRTASSPQEQIACLEEMLSTIPKHKGTDKLRGDLRKKLSKLKSASQARKGVSRHDSAFVIDKEGAGQVALVGHANVGKSALVAMLTNANPEVADFPFTTWKPTPGMMPYENIQIQLIDTPPLNRDFVEPELIELIRRADLILLVVDIHTDPVRQLQETVAFLEKYRIAPCHKQDQSANDGRISFKPMLVLANKNDDERTDENFEIFKALLEEEWPILPISAISGRNFDRLKQILFEELDIVRVYSKAPGRDPDYSAPFILESGTTVEEFARKVHLDFYEKLKAARVWGSAEFEGQMVSRDYILQDGDVVELRI